MVTIDAVLPGYSSVMSDNIEGGYAIAKCLLDRGHRRIGVIHGEDNNVTKRRLNGVYRAFREYGVQTDPIYFRTGRFHNTEDATRLTLEFMNLPNPPTAIMYQDDFAFIGGYIRWWTNWVFVSRRTSALRDMTVFTCHRSSAQSSPPICRMVQK